ncbi:hypothetical protein MLD38_028345 [Melastoma candidum]|uniref:Uncharacterized protein n=1 Tax=Melastoma candidum TaxID=119954 RepID=A0ACB9N549_9MYRT|nr:hypothetical protein MLD38_028345 [Melastoma candidum]
MASLWASPLPGIHSPQRLLPPPAPFHRLQRVNLRTVGWSERRGRISSRRPKQRRTSGLHVQASSGNEGLGSVESSQEFQQWDSLTAKFSASANLPFLLIQLPQIILNARNLMAGNKAALLAVPWLGMLTGLLGNLSLLSYFAKKREKEAIVVQTLGVVSIYVVLSQLALGSAMPLPIFVVVSVVIASGLVLNFMYYFGFINPRVWSFWEDFITVGGLSVLPQVMWSTFIPYVPESILPGSAAFLIAVVAVFMSRTGRLSEKGVKFVGAISGWTATLLFMWMPIAQMWTNIQFPENIKGLSASTMLLGMIGNALMVPRALFIRDFMWFTGSSWAALFYGYGNIVWLYCCNCISREYFLGATVGLFSWIGISFWRDTVANGYSNPLRSVKELVFGP